MSATAFRAFPQFNAPELAEHARSNHRKGPAMAAAFAGDRVQDRIVQALMRRGAVTVKEILESFEVHDRTRRRLRAPHMADLACGHGLTGLLFATERVVESVTLVDQAVPASFDAIRDAVVEVCPWVADKIRVLRIDLADVAAHLEPGTSCVAVHACGAATDQVLDIAVAVEGPVAVMGCCFVGTARSVPPAIRDALGPELATDVRRTWRLHDAGYQVDWDAIPAAITPMNRVLIARRP